MLRLGMLLLALWPVAGAAQSGTGIPFQAVDRFGAAPAPVPSSERSLFPVEPGHAAYPGERFLATPPGAFAASLLVPGAGQASLGLRRWMAYGALELGLWALHLDAAGDVRRLSTQYRDLAWEAARLPTGPGERREGSWGYYETMSQFLRSGTFDRDPSTPGLQPETDETTYNGQVWALARGLFLGPGGGGPGDPSYEEALDYYRAQAVGPDFLWSWLGATPELDRFRGLIRDADGRARVRSMALGLVLANHMVSAVDALLVARLRTPVPVRMTNRIEPGPVGYRWHVGLEISLPNGQNGHPR